MEFTLPRIISYLEAIKSRGACQTGEKIVQNRNWPPLDPVVIINCFEKLGNCLFHEPTDPGVDKVFGVIFEPAELLSPPGDK